MESNTNRARTWRNDWIKTISRRDRAVVSCARALLRSSGLLNPSGSERPKIVNNSVDIMD